MRKVKPVETESGTQREDGLENVPIDMSVAIKKTKLSASYLQKLPDDTPGIYRFGRRRKINLVEFTAWARQQAVERAQRRKGLAPRGAA